MNLQDYLGKEKQTYYAGQWAEAGVYRCLDPCSPEEKIVFLKEDGILPDPTHGWIARFRRVRILEKPEIWRKEARNDQETHTQTKAQEVNQERLVL